MTVYDNRVVMIPKNETVDEKAAIRVEIARETDLVTIGLVSWGGNDKRVDFPVQFLGDVQNALRKIGEVVE